MCGRYVLTDTGELQTRFDIATTGGGPEVAARYNIAPTQTLPVVTRHSPNRLEAMRWGLIPSWAKDASIGSRLINARAETVAEKPSFRNALRARRCLVPASGFYEWKRHGTRKIPQYITLPDAPLFAFAGLWEQWRSPEGETVRSYTIITTEPNDLMATIHNRMPVILPREIEDDWLNGEITDAGYLQSLLRPYPADAMTAYAVSPAVSSPARDTPDLIRPTAEVEIPGSETRFGNSA